MKTKAIIASLALLSPVFADAAIHPGFVNLKQCVYFADGATQRSDCTNSNTTCLSDGRCAVDTGSAVHDGEVEELILLRKLLSNHERYEPYVFGDDVIIDLRGSNLTREQFIFER